MKKYIGAILCGIALFFGELAIAAPSDVSGLPATANGVRYRDLSGTGAGPFIPETMCVDGSGNACSFGGGSVTQSGNWNVGGFTTIAGGTFTRPANATAYASGQLVANSVTAGSVTPITFTGAARSTGGTGMIRRMRLSKSGTSLTNASFRVHVYRDLPTVTNGDGGVWLSTMATYIGCFDVTIDKAFSDGAKGVGTPCVGSEINYDTSGSANLYGLIEARAAYTPASGETFTPAGEFLPN